MRGLELRPRQRSRPRINITSLIDVLFLLLIFIMVSSTFVEHPAIELDLPEATSAEGAEVDPLTLSVTADGRLFLDGVELGREELLGRLREEVAADPELTLNLRADQTVDYGLVIQAVDAARQAEVRKISAFTDAPASAEAEAEDEER